MKVQKSPENNNMKKQRGLASVRTEQRMEDINSPIPKLWQQNEAGYHNEGWKGDPIESAKDKQEGQDEA